MIIGATVFTDDRKLLHAEPGITILNHLMCHQGLARLRLRAGGAAGLR
jgi:hypothetical protein